MVPRFVLVHSPAVGPSTWKPVAGSLAALGASAVVPSLLRAVAAGGPPFWPPIVDAVVTSATEAGAEAGAEVSAEVGAEAGVEPPAGPPAAEPADAPPERPPATTSPPAPGERRERRRQDHPPSGERRGGPLIVVAHSNAGLFVPLIAARLGERAAGCVLVDAALPPPSGDVPVAPPELLAPLRGKARDGLLPPWTRWWDEPTVAALFPDEATRRVVEEEQPRLPLSYFEATVPVPAGWDRRPCAYVLFGPPYEETAAAARERGWPVERFPGRHLHQLVDPDGLARLLLVIAGRMLADHEPEPGAQPPDATA